MQTNSTKSTNGATEQRRRGRLARPTRGDPRRHPGDGEGRIEVSAFRPAAIGPGGALLAILLIFDGSACKAQLSLAGKRRASSALSIVADIDSGSQGD